MELSRRQFLQATAATSAALAIGPSKWGWAVEGSPFGPLQDDPLLRLPQGFSYKVIAETGTPLEGGRGPATRPQFPDLNISFGQKDGKILLCTSHEVPAEAPIGQPPPQEEYDHLATGAITSLLLRPDLTIAESAYNAGGMVSNCSGGNTPWKTLLTGEEATNTLEADHGFIWEVDPHRHTKVRLDDCGRFEHEAAIIDRKTGFVYLTEDSGTDSLLYRMRPRKRNDLEQGGILEAFKRSGRWARIDDPLGSKGLEPSAQGIKKGALKFHRLEGARRWGRWMYFTETEDDTACGKVWRLHLDTFKLELWAQGSPKGRLCMPDNIVFDRVGNMFVCEDKGEASTDNQNRILFIDRSSGKISLFGKLSAPQSPGVRRRAHGPMLRSRQEDPVPQPPARRWRRQDAGNHRSLRQGRPGVDPHGGGGADGGATRGGGRGERADEARALPGDDLRRGVWTGQSAAQGKDGTVAPGARGNSRRPGCARDRPITAKADFEDLLSPDPPINS